MGTVGPGCDPPAQRPLRRQEVATPRCSRSAGRCRARRSAATSSRRSTTTRCSPTSRCSAGPSRSADQLPLLLEQAVQRRARSERGVAVLTLPGDVGGLDLPKRHAAAALRRRAAAAAARRRRGRCDAAAARSTRPGRSRCSSGRAPGDARDEVLALAERLRRADGADAQGQGGARARQPLRGRPVRADRQPGRARRPSTTATLLLMLGTDFPYRDWYPTGKTVVQLDARGEHIGRRTPVDARARRRRRGSACAALLPLRRARRPTARTSRRRASGVPRLAASASTQLADPDYDEQAARACCARKVDNPDDRIRPEALAAAVDRHAADDAIFTTDTGMSTVWLSRFVRMTRHAAPGRLLQPRLDGQRDAAGARRAGARPRPPGRRVLRRRRPDDAAGRPDHRRQPTTCRSSSSSSTTAGSAWSSSRRSRSGCRSSAPCCTTPTSPRSPRRSGCTGIRVERPRRGRGGGARRRSRTTARCCSTCVTNPDEVAVPPKPTLEQGGASRSPRRGSSWTAPSRPLSALGPPGGERSARASGGGSRASCPARRGDSRRSRRRPSTRPRARRSGSRYR